MSNFRNFLVFILLFFSFCGQLTASSKQNLAFRNFWHPTYLGQRLDYCTLDGKECGKEVANRYCQMLGYDYSTQNVIAYNVGLTNYLGSKAQCKGWRCNGFMTIACAIGLSHTPPKPYHYREKNLPYPVIMITEWIGVWSAIKAVVNKLPIRSVIVWDICKPRIS